jgi:peptide/nickel transport system permease protein
MGAMAIPEMVAAIMEHYRLSYPVQAQYLKWLSNALHGDLGRSFSTNKLVIKEFMDHLGPTLIPNLSGILIALCIATGNRGLNGLDSLQMLTAKLAS